MLYEEIAILDNPHTCCMLHLTFVEYFSVTTPQEQWKSNVCYVVETRVRKPKESLEINRSLLVP